MKIDLGTMPSGRTLRITSDRYQYIVENQEPSGAWSKCGYFRTLKSLYAELIEEELRLNDATTLGELVLAVTDLSGLLQSSAVIVRVEVVE